MHVSPRPSACAGAPIERGFERAEVERKLDRKARSRRRETTLHHGKRARDEVTPAWHRRLVPKSVEFEAAVAGFALGWLCGR